MGAFASILALTAPLFALILLGFALKRFGRLPSAAADWMTRFVFTLAVPALLFRLMSDRSQLPSVDARLLFAYFGSCVAVFAASRVVARRMFAMDGVGQSVFGIASVFSNTVLLGIPLAKVVLGDSALPAISLVIVFNSLLLWTLVTISVEWARHGAMSWRAFARTAWSVLTNPVVASILLGTAWGVSGLRMPGLVDDALALLARAAVPLSLLALGMSLAQYDARAGWRESAAICGLKLALQPVVAFALARALALPPLETQAIVLLAAMPVGANVFVMSREFGALQGPVATSLVASTALSAATTPLLLALCAAAI